MKINIDKEKCIGCGVCVSIAPNTFELKEGKAQVKNPKGDPEELVREAARSCPTQVIEIEE